jgi:hypothetical protein
MVVHVAINGENSDEHTHNNIYIPVLDAHSNDNIDLQTSQLYIIRHFIFYIPI